MNLLRNTLPGESIENDKSSLYTNFVVESSQRLQTQPHQAPWSSVSASPVTAVKTHPFTTSFVPLLRSHQLALTLIDQVAINSSKRRDALPLEKLGEYDPIPRPPPTSTSLAHAVANSFHLASRAPEVARESREKRIVWDVERIRYWLGVGAQPTESVVKLLERVSRCSCSGDGDRPVRRAEKERGRRERPGESRFKLWTVVGRVNNGLERFGELQRPS